MQTSPLDTEALMWVTPRPDLLFAEGKGSFITDQHGKLYLDFVQGWAVNCLGHCPQVITEALVRQSTRLINPSPAFFNGPAASLASLIAKNSTLDRVFFANSGAEANEGAIKLARKWGQKRRNGAYEIITMMGSFHGRTLATMSASGKPGWDTLYAPQVPGFPKAELNDLDSVERLITDQTVAVMLEPIQGEAGVVLATDEFLLGLRRLTQERDLLLILDEVQTGCGRTGSLFCYEHSGVQPDIMTLGKGIGGGVPLAALVAREEICVFEAGDQGGTYNGNPLMTAVGLSVLETLLSDGFLKDVKAKGEYLSQQLQSLCQDFSLVGERGMGLLRALILPEERGPKLVESARALGPMGLLINAPRPQLLRFMPALTVSRAEIDQMVEMLRRLFIG
jgi:acetylornithine/N-succinyldiaminopimelate aminotransferase